MSRAELAQRMELIKARFKQQLEESQTLADGKVKAFSNQLLKFEERLGVFVRYPGSSQLTTPPRGLYGQPLSGAKLVMGASASKGVGL